MSALPLSFASCNNLEKFTSLSESLSLAEKECNKFRIINTTQSNLRSISQELDPRHRSRISQKCKRKMDQFRGKDSIFKRPECPAPSRAIPRSIPDHHKNPHKWTKYSLGDVSNADMSDRSNAQAAFSFLNDLKSRKQLTCGSSEEEESMQIGEPVLFKSKNRTNSQIQFRKPKNDTTGKIADSSDTPENDKKAIFRNSKVVMPEYIVGQKPIKKIHKKDNSEADNRSKNVKLDHLQDAEEEEEEES
ncbi:uncharacterized protein LOC117170160 [Belonocnema kinseyi]|uniref:uncharacterized protein LOC117170160 n=1 Tax=Belonocnema kinseyi TaxID=2817044 RepID=UPI00143D1554|nr:uncharacterized protein LOC117170160 [Belonocnema kinseyi]XP_033212614.1 uncharacterized protein LOC117170160 [Belonocnema kinseyi]